MALSLHRMPAEKKVIVTKTCGSTSNDKFGIMAIMTNSGANSDDKVNIMTTLGCFSDGTVQPLI